MPFRSVDCVLFCTEVSNSDVAQFLCFHFAAYAFGVKTWIWSLGQEDPLEEQMAIHSSILVWRIPWTEEPGGRQSMSHKELDTTEQLTLSLWCHVQEVTKSNVIEEAFPLWFFPKRFCFFVFLFLINSNFFICSMWEISKLQNWGKSTLFYVDHKKPTKVKSYLIKWTILNQKPRYNVCFPEKP